ncbi:MAG: hypothetical protein WDO15_13020 [Bacteroidota bacterium]
MRRYIDQFIDGDKLLANEGGFVFANDAATLKFPTAYNSTAGRIASEPESLTNSIDQPDWEVMLNVQHGAVTNTFGGIGMNRNANTTYDEFDDFTLPRFIDYVELNHAKKFLNTAFTKDVVPTTENFSWEFTVDTENQRPHRNQLEQLLLRRER